MDLSQDSDVEYVGSNNDPGYNESWSQDVKELLKFFHEPKVSLLSHIICINSPIDVQS